MCEPLNGSDDSMNVQAFTLGDGHCNGQGTTLEPRTAAARFSAVKAA